MNRQQRRKAIRQLLKGNFPFPDLLDWFVEYVRNKPTMFAQIQEDGTVVSNLTGDTETYDIVEFRAMLDNLKVQDENAVDNS